MRRPFRPYKKFNKFQRFDKNRKRINQQIRIPEVRVADEKGQQIGVMSTEKALALAREKGLDLVEVAEKATPPVCRIIDYGKYQYQQEKKARESKSKQTKIEVKGIRIKFKTAINDLKTKAKQTDKFLKSGHKVKVEILLRGREKAFKDLARERILEFPSLLETEVEIQQEPKKQPNGFTMIIAKKQ